MFRRDEYQILNKMLDDAISGDFYESRFDESELSKLQSKLMRYLSSSSMSERKLQEEALSEVDREKYPDATQRYRFELQDIKSVAHPND